MARRYRPYELDQQLLFPPNTREWVPAGLLATFIADLVAKLDLSAFV